jgi:hypothetical protein
MGYKSSLLDGLSAALKGLGASTAEHRDNLQKSYRAPMAEIDGKSHDQSIASPSML